MTAVPAAGSAGLPLAVGSLADEMARSVQPLADAG
jgi:hypothetical protein